MDGGPRPVVDKQDARSGETSGHMRWVLGVSIALVVIAFAALMLGWF